MKAVLSIQFDAVTHEQIKVAAAKNIRSVSGYIRALVCNDLSLLGFDVTEGEDPSPPLEAQHVDANVNYETV